MRAWLTSSFCLCVRFQSTVQVSRLQDLINRSKMARCRGRFVCPVILFKGKHICRSATLAGWGELYGRSGYNYFFSGGTDDTWANVEDVTEEDSGLRSGDTHLFDKVRGCDIKLLRYLSVKYICDLMVENKKVKFGMNVTSSEKVDKAQRYADFTLLSIPYPGRRPGSNSLCLGVLGTVWEELCQAAWTLGP